MTIKEAPTNHFAYQYNKKTGATYVYSVNSYWDKEKKAPRNKQAYIGKLDRETGEIIPSQRKKPRQEPLLASESLRATAKIAGPYMLLEQIAQQTGIASLLRQCFPELHSEILSLVYFIAQKGLPLSRSEPWSTTHLHPMHDAFSSQRISEILLKIAENGHQKFLSLWLKKTAASDYLCYDITSISSYSQGNEYARYGYNRDGEPLPQINLAVLFGQKSRLPVYYRRMPGNIPDVATLKTTMKELDFLDDSKARFVLDRGFYSKANVDELLEQRHHFTIAVPSGRKWVEAVIERHCESVASPENYHEVNGSEALYAATELYKWGESSRRMYMHVYYNAARAADEFDRFTRRLLRHKRELESEEATDGDRERFARYFIVKETLKRGITISFNDEEIQRYRKRYAGFFCILSTTHKAPMEALRVYRAKEIVENCFDDLKNQLDMKRLRIHSSSAMDSRIFLQFLALVFMCRIRDTISTDRELWNLTVREVMETMESVVRIKYSGRYRQLYTEVGPMQRKIMKAFGVTIPT
jgi:transposase